MAAAPAVCRFGSFICCPKLRLYLWPEAKFSTITLNAFASFFAATLASICNARPRSALDMAMMNHQVRNSKTVNDGLKVMPKR